MNPSRYPRHFLLRQKPTSSLKGFSFFSILMFSILFFACLILIFLSERSLSLLFIVFICFSLVYSKFRHQNSSKSLPKFSNLQVMRCFFHLIRNRSTARTKFLEIFYGGYLCLAKEGIFSFDILTQKCVVASEQGLVETLLSSTTILKKGFPYKMIKDLLKEGLATSSGSVWHSRRKLLTPAFHFRILKEFTPVFNKHAKSLVSKIENLMDEQGSFDIVPLARLCTLDVILETAMGKPSDGDQDHFKEYVEALETWNSCISRRFVFPVLWPDFIFYRTKTGKTYRKSLSIMEQLTRKVITERLQERLKRPNDMRLNDLAFENNEIGRKSNHQLALLDLLVDLHMQDKNTLSFQDIEDEVGTFVFAGNETTTSAISFTLYLLGLHSDIQRNVQEEVDMVLGDDVDRTITDADIKKFKYLSCVLKEALRLFPAVPNISRYVEEDTVINGYKISKGSTILIPIYMLHRNPEIFPNPEKFDPERFSPKNIKNRHPFAYIPFSAGSRNCIGQKFAMNSLIIFLATVLRHFDVSAEEPRDQLKLVVGIVLTPENGLHLKFNKRQFLRNYSS